MNILLVKMTSDRGKNLKFGWINCGCFVEFVELRRYFLDFCM